MPSAIAPKTAASKPNVMCFSGLDPTGGAGIQADIETIGILGGHCLPLITVMTEQNTANVLSAQPCDADYLKIQANTVLSDMSISCFKLGLMPTVDIVEVVASLLLKHPNKPVVIDPVLIAGGGYAFADERVTQAIKSQLLPLATLVTPNTQELYALAGHENSEEEAIQALLSLGCRAVLLTGTHAETDTVINKLVSADDSKSTSWPRLEGSYHGSGCTLASAVAAGLAKQQSLETAVADAQEFTWNALSKARRPGAGQLLPDRL